MAALKKMTVENSVAEVWPLNNRKLNLRSWSIFTLLEDDFLAKVRLASVFGNMGNEALVVTTDDEVFAIGIVTILAAFRTANFNTSHYLIAKNVAFF
jgi:hypothetical protein